MTPSQPGYYWARNRNTASEPAIVLLWRDSSMPELMVSSFGGAISELSRYEILAGPLVYRPEDTAPAPARVPATCDEQIEILKVEVARLSSTVALAIDWLDAAGRNLRVQSR